MAKLYYNRIKKGLMTIDEVPEKWRAEVQRMLDEDAEAEAAAKAAAEAEAAAAANAVEVEPVSEPSAPVVPDVVVDETSVEETPTEEAPAEVSTDTNEAVAL